MQAINDIGDGVTWPDRFLMISLLVTALIIGAAMGS